MKQHNDKYAWAVKIGEKGQFVIPKKARDIFDIKPGDTIIVLADKKKGIAIPPKSMFAKLAETVFEGDLSEMEDDYE
ncbi:AbrB/MazE/SpoVT family DNA-binding domain-containing protein [Alkaliphilus sp. B6464]|uniref:AbrB/MazE/SpoVT family DNA-binding domain-containing protein n=1 Tax=Alkaliphilus sp. B6464 TaxID=2731219 RepID=UPI001BA6ABC8|nr:AbrB/MazE/SpoVT family DNA-binding domain-containing protein [Alkaliphilus sp. B6464]QUH20267.1 AbrB/MazE/SpoVT family DNA-binding domain-containing protein [Alkaliphilus sp. B6464]